MKLSLVADYELPNSKRAVATFAIDASSNLVGLVDMCSMSFPLSDCGFVRVTPTFLLMCESKRKAETVAKAWEKVYKDTGMAYVPTPLSAIDVCKKKEATK